MYIAVVATIFGRALLFGNVALLEYGAFVWVLFHLFVLIYEEPKLRSTFGAEYDSFYAKVPRWIPSFKNRPDSAPRTRNDKMNRPTKHGTRQQAHPRDETASRHAQR